MSLEASPSDVAVIDGMNVTINGECTLTAIATLGGTVKTSTLNVTIKSDTPTPTGTFKLLTDLDQLTEGAEVIIAYGTNAVSSIVRSSKIDPATIIIDNDKNIITDNGDAAIFTLEKGSGNNWYFKTKDGKYLTGSSSSSTTVSLPDSKGTYSLIYISTGKETDTFKLQFGNSTNTRALLWRAGSTKQFANYSAGNATSQPNEYHCVNIYYREAATAKPEFVVPETATFEIDADGTKYYTNPFKLALSCPTEGATIHYSKDGSDSTPYTADLYLDKDCTVSAYATLDGLPQSETVTETFNFRTATPVIICTDPEEAQVKTVTITCATEGATIMYSLDNGETWLPYEHPLEFSEVGKTVNIMARARSSFESENVYTGEVQYQVSIYPPLDWKPFELVTDITTLVPGDRVIFVAKGYDYALAPYAGNGDNNCKAAAITKSTSDEGVPTVRLEPGSQEVGIYAVEKTADGKYKFKGTFTEGYLSALAGNDNLLHCHKPEETPATPLHVAEATVVISPEGVATVTFEGEGVTHNTMRFFNGSAKVFSCYDPATTGTYDINIYRRGVAANFAPRPSALPQEGVYEKNEISEVTLQCLDEEGNEITDPTLKIYYTLDGTNPRNGGLLYTGPIAVTGNLTVRAYAAMDDHFDSPSLIANYSIFEPGRQYRRVTAAEMHLLGVDDDIIILGSPSDSEEVYALGRTQLGDGTAATREAIKLDNVVKSDGRIVINKKTVQTLTILAGDDYYGGYDWRLYASGSSVGADHNSDGFLLAEGDNNALRTIRIDTPASDRLPNADVRFRNAAESDYGNEYGGVTVQFGSADGHENDWPKLMALTRGSDGVYRFDVRKQADFTATTASSWYVSVFKAFDSNMLYAPTFTNLDLRIGIDTPIELTSPNTDDHPDTEIWYSLDNGASWTKYTEAFFITDMGEHTILARTRNPKLAGGDAEGYSVTVEKTYIVTDNEIFELVTNADQLKENDRIIFVNAIKYNGRYSNEGDAGWYIPADFDTSEGRFNSVAVEPLDASEAIPSQLIVPTETSAQVFRLEYDTSAKNPDRPWLLYARGQDKYLRSAKAKQFELTDLPDDIDSRQYMNAGFEIEDRVDYSNYSSNNYESMVSANAFVTFSGLGSITNYLRFNPMGGLRFRGYDNGGKGQPSPSTWPVRVYRAAKRVLPPTVTIYDAVGEGKNAYETEIETFSNAVRVVITHNPGTDAGTELRYSWSETKANAPVLSEYLEAEPKDADEIQLYVDGNKVQIFNNGAFEDIPALGSIDSRHVLRAVAADGMNASQSLPRAVNFKCSKPVVAKAGVAGESVQVSRPGNYTVGARLYYSYDDAEVVEDEAFRVNYAAGSTEFEPISFEGRKKVNVRAFKEGYEPSDIAEFTSFTFVPRAHAIQLLELTDKGKTEFAAILDDASFIDEGRNYVTNRTVVTGQFYVIKEQADGKVLMTPVNNNVTARDLIEYRPKGGHEAGVNVNWTTDYYVHVLNETEFLNAIGGAEVLATGNVADVKASIYVNGATDAIPTQRISLKLNGEDMTYRGALLKRGGAIGSMVLNSTLEYSVTTDNGTSTYRESGSDQITPKIPSVYGGHYAYTHTQEPQDLSGRYPTDFLKFTIESRVHKNDDGSWAKSEVLIPTADLDPRHLDATITFYRPNVSKEILLRNDIYYTIKLTGSMLNVKGSGLYVDRAQASLENVTDAEIPEKYQFVITDLSPREEYFPTLEVVSTEYVENYSADENYGRFISNYGDNLEVEASNNPMLRTGEVSKVHLGKLEPGQSDRSGNKNLTDQYAWMYKGHNDLKAPNDVVHPGDDTEEEVLMAPVYYHVETYSTSHSDYASYEYLVKHVEGHNDTDTPALDFGSNGNFITDDEYDPLLGTYVATHFDSSADICMALTPVYIFTRDPNASPEEGGSNVIAPLEKVQSVNSVPAMAPSKVAAQPVRKAAPATSAFGKDITAPVVDEIRPMRHYGHTDMTAANITDLTAADVPFDVVPGSAITHQLQEDEVTGVDNVAVDGDDDAEVEYFNLQGQRIARPDHGIYIERRGSKARKIAL